MEEEKAETKVDTALPLASAADAKIEQKPADSTVTPAAKTEITTEKVAETPIPNRVPENVVAKLRAERRELREEVKRLKVEAETSKRLSTAQEATPPEFLENPDARLAYERQQIKREVMSEVDARNAEFVRAKKVQEEGQSAISYLLKANEINGDMTKVEEIDNIIMDTPELSQIVGISPMIAAKHAYELWKTERGMGTEQKKTANRDLASLQTPKVTPVSPVAPRTIKDIKAELRRIDPVSDPKWKEKHSKLIEELASYLK